jgi:predicted lipid carrier protein YhbT
MTPLRSRSYAGQAEDRRRRTEDRIENREQRTENAERKEEDRRRFQFHIVDLKERLLRCARNDKLPICRRAESELPFSAPPEEGDND